MRTNVQAVIVSVSDTVAADYQVRGIFEDVMSIRGLGLPPSRHTQVSVSPAVAEELLADAHRRYLETSAHLKKAYRALLGNKRFALGHLESEFEDKDMATLAADIAQRAIYSARLSAFRR